MRRRWWTGTVHSEQIPPGIVLTALFPYVMRFITETLFVDGLCWVPYADWQRQISHHPSLLCPSVRCTLLAGDFVPGSIFNLWLMFDFLPSLSPSQIVLPKNVDWKQATVFFSSTDWTWGLSSVDYNIVISSNSRSNSIFVFHVVQVLELRKYILGLQGFDFSIRSHLLPLWKTSFIIICHRAAFIWFCCSFSCIIISLECFNL